ncbi:MAG: energy transducer TonB [Gammaproteobacteria bacterium]|nr:energy transducer TonB [Gammaproteobacteria bacterium]
MLRASIAILLGGAVTFGLFAFMAFLVNSDGQRLQAGAKSAPLVINQEQQETKVKKTNRLKPKPPALPNKPPPPMQIKSETNQAQVKLALNLQAVNIRHGISAGLSGPVLGQDGDATPIVRIDPRYPMKASRAGKEGYVILSFSINKLGGVDDIQVIEAKPKRLFSKAARRALKRWKYKPKIVDGQPQKQLGQTVRLDFVLEKRGS